MEIVLAILFFSMGTLMSGVQVIKLIYFSFRYEEINHIVNKSDKPYFLYSGFVISGCIFSILVWVTMSYIAMTLYLNYSHPIDLKYALLILPAFSFFSFFIFRHLTFHFFAYKIEISKDNSLLQNFSLMGKSLTIWHLILSLMLTISFFFLFFLLFLLKNYLLSHIT